MIRKLLSNFFANLFYPTDNSNWYREKNYIGKNFIEEFEIFLQSQKHKASHYYNEFKDLELKRYNLTSSYTKSHIIDVVVIMPGKINSRKAGYKNAIIFFQGRGEYYESRFRDMAIQARETGATIIGFNPRGFKSSTGKLKIIEDYVEDGIDVVKFVNEKLKFNFNQIILQGNSLGAGVQALVNSYFYKNYQIRFREINSNSFKNISSVIAQKYYFNHLEYILKPILSYAGWEVNLGDEFYEIGPHRISLRRLDDKTILPKSQYHYHIDLKKSLANSPESYHKTLYWLYENSELSCDEILHRDIHKISLNNLKVTDKKKRYSVYKIINKFISESNKYF